MNAPGTCKCKGHFGGAMISSKHTLAIANSGNATAEDIIELSNLITSGVKQKFGIQLTIEPRILKF